MNEIKRTNIETGLHIKIVLKEYQQTGKISEAATRNKSMTYQRTFSEKLAKLEVLKKCWNGILYLC